MIDSTIVKAHPCATGYYKNGLREQGIGRSKGGLTSKAHFMVDTLGNALKFIISPGNESDINKAKYLIQDIRNAAIMGYKGYDSNDLRDTIKNQGCGQLYQKDITVFCPSNMIKNLIKHAI